MHVLQLCFSLLCRHGDDACSLSPTPVSLTLTLSLKHLQQPLDALITVAQCLFLRINSHLHFLHGFPQQEQLLGLPLMLWLQPEEIFLWWIQRRRWWETITPWYLAGAAGPECTRNGHCHWTLARTVDGLTWAVPWHRLKGVGWADSLRSYSSVTAITRAMNDDINFLLSWIVGVGRTGSWAFLWSRTVQVTGALSRALARAEPTSVVLVRDKFSIRARVSLLSLLVQATVHLPMSPQLLLKLLNCQRKLLQKQSAQISAHSFN